MSFVVASRSDRADGVPLTGQPLSGGPFIYLTPLFPDPAPRRVEFFIDDALVNVEVSPTLDVAGGLPEQSFPVDTTRLRNGRHRLVASVTAADGHRELVVASLVVNNSETDDPGTLGALVSAADGAALDRRTIGHDGVLELQPFASSGATINHVRFFVDAEYVGRSDAGPYRLDLAHPTITDVDRRVGQHMIRAVAILNDGSLWAVDANFVIGPPLLSTVG